MDVDELRRLLATAGEEAFVYAELSPVLAMLALDVGMEFGAMERRGEVLEGVYHVHGGTIDPVWIRIDCEGCSDLVLLPGSPGDPLRERWAGLADVVRRILEAGPDDEK